jgi:hypothetical protein
MAQWRFAAEGLGKIKQRRIIDKYLTDNVIAGDHVTGDTVVGSAWSSSKPMTTLLKELVLTGSKHLVVSSIDRITRNIKEYKRLCSVLPELRVTSVTEKIHAKPVSDKRILDSVTRAQARFGSPPVLPEPDDESESDSDSDPDDDVVVDDDPSSDYDPDDPDDVDDYD